MVFKALPCACGQILGGRDALRGEIRQSGIVVLAVVHQDLAHATKSQVLVRAFGCIGHDDEGDMFRCQGLGSLPIEVMSANPNMRSSAIVATTHSQVRT